MIRPDVQTSTVTTPSGINVTVKQSLSYGDNKLINASFGDLAISADGTPPTISLTQAQAFATATVLQSVIGWDVTEADGTATPFNKENMEAIFADADVNFLMKEIKGDTEKKNS